MMSDNKCNREGGAMFGGGKGARALSAPRAIGTMVVAGIAMMAASRGDATSSSSKLDLLSLQVFAKQSIQSQNSDYEGPIAAGGNVDLTDFEVLGDLTSGGRVFFQRGHVKGLVNAANPQLSQVFSSGTGSAPGLATDLAAMKLDLLAARISALSATATFDQAVGSDGKTEFRAMADRSPEVVDLQGDRLTSSDGEVRLALSGDRNAAMVVRVHGRSVRMRNVGFSANGGLTPSRIVYYFPEATELEIASSGGAVDSGGKPWNIPGSIVAPNAALKFVASTVTGQVFARSILSVPGAAGGQVDRLPADGPTVGEPDVASVNFRPSALLQMIAGEDFADRFLAVDTAPTGALPQTPAGCHMVCPYHAELAVPPDSP